MKNVAIFRFAQTEGPGFLTQFLDENHIPWSLFKIDENEGIPQNPGDFSGLVFMGGPMSVNDDLPWIAPVLGLIGSAVSKDIPVLGHCLGGQLISRALGGIVSTNGCKEIGWGKVQVARNAEAEKWFGGSFDAFHWHGETFSVPIGAKNILSSPYCANQAFSLGPHLAMQCHVEMTEEMVEKWCEAGRQEIEMSPGESVQSAAQMRRNLPEKVAELNRVARGIYAVWVRGLK